MTTAALWFLAIVFLIIFATILAVGYARYKELKTAENRANQTHNDVREMQQQFRIALQELANNELIGSQQRQGIGKLINNFFIFQPINEVNFGHFDELYQSLMSSIHAINAPTTANQSDVAIAFHELAARLPIDNSDYSARFFLDTAPVLAKQLNERVNQLIIAPSPEAEIAANNQREENVATETVGEQSDEINTENFQQSDDKAR